MTNDAPQTPAEFREILRQEYQAKAAALTELRDQLAAKMATHSCCVTRDHKRIILQLQRTIDWINREAAAFDAEQPTA